MSMSMSMNYTLKRACVKCPFRRGGVMTLRPSRADEIAALFDGRCDTGTFPCHETLDYHSDGDGEDDCGGKETDKTQHCAGALIFAEKHEKPTQMMRICERLGLYDRTALVGEDDIWDDTDEWVDAMENV